MLQSLNYLSSPALGWLRYVHVVFALGSLEVDPALGSLELDPDEYH